MSASEPPKNLPADGAAGGDPSMEDILASIRRILSEDEVPGDAPPQAPGRAADSRPTELPAQEWQRETLEAQPVDAQDGLAVPPHPADLLILDSSMMIVEPAQPEASLPEPPIPPSVPLMTPDNTEPSTLIAPAVAAAAATSVGSMVRDIAADRAMQVHSGGPTLEDIVREELRPLLKQWLDEHLPVMVERLVRVELERVIGRAAS